jgi:hypothetical protein
MRGRNMYQRGWRTIGLATVIALLPAAAWACAVCFEGDDGAGFEYEYPFPDVHAIRDLWLDLWHRVHHVQARPEAWE